MDLGLLDGNLTVEFKKLSREQLEEVAHLLMLRLTDPNGKIKVAPQVERRELRRRAVPG